MAAGSIIIDILARTGSFETDTKRAEASLKKFQNEAKKVGAAVGAAFAAVGAATAMLVKGSIDAMDNLSKLAQATGTTTEALSALGYAAEMSGVSQETLGTSLQKLSRQAAEAAAGNKQVAATFDAIGVSVKKTDGTLKTSEELMREIAGQFSQYADGAEKTALAQELFGRSGAQLIPLLNSGAEGLAEMTAEAEALGLVIGGDTAKAAEQFNDNLSRLDAIKRGLINRIAAELLPTLTNLTSRLFESAKASGALDQAARAASAGVRILLSVGAIIVGVFKTIGEALGGVAATLVALFSGRFRDAFEIGKNVALDFAGNIRSTAGTVSTIWDTTAQTIQSRAPSLGQRIAAPIVQAAATASRATRELANNVERTIAGLARDVSTFGLTNTQVKLFDLQQEGANPEQLGRAAGYLAQLDAMTAKEKMLADAAQARQRIMEEGRSLYDQTRTPLERLNIETSKLNDLLKNGAIDWETYSRAIFQAQEAYDATLKTVEEIDPAVKDLGMTFTSAFEDAVVNGKKLSEVLKGLAQDVLRIVTRRTRYRAFRECSDRSDWKPVRRVLWRGQGWRR